MSKLRKPSLSIGGTKPQDLIDGAMDIRDKIKDALRLMGEHHPHARDYYSQTNIRYFKARDAWHERMEHLVQIDRDLMEWAIEIDKETRT